MDRQSIIEHGVVLVFVLAVVLILLAVFNGVLGTPEDRLERWAVRVFTERDALIQECMASERYTVDQCILIAGEDD